VCVCVYCTRAGPRLSTSRPTPGSASSPRRIPSVRSALDRSLARSYDMSYLHCGFPTFLSIKLTFLSIKLTFLSIKLTFLSFELTFLSLKLTFLSLKLTFLSFELTFLSLKLTFLSIKLTFLSMNREGGAQFSHPLPVRYAAHRPCVSHREGCA
jgi:hypothetical protein